MKNPKNVAFWREHLLIDIERFRTGKKMLTQRWTHTVSGRFDVVSTGVHAIKKEIQIDLLYLGGMAGEW